jgi:hypothetical protein
MAGERTAGRPSPAAELPGGDQQGDLTQYRQLVHVLLSGGCPAPFRDRDTAVQALLAQVRHGTWQTAEERSEAQALMARLHRLLPATPSPAQTPSRPTTPPAPPAAAPALTVEILRRWKVRSAKQRLDKVD